MMLASRKSGIIACMSNPGTIEDEISRLLNARGFDDGMRVDAVLKESPFELTERVFFRGQNGPEAGPYVRKTFKGAREQRELGAVYQILLDAQKSGARFAHLPRIISVIDAADELVVIMEFVEGDTLRDRIQRYSEFRLEIARAVFPQLCSAVIELHEMLGKTIVHRDITPSNVICCGKDAVPLSTVLIDFGIARTYKPEATSDTTRFGTAEYAAPEQFGYGQTDERTDVYALGMVLAYCLLGHDPSMQEVKEGFAGDAIPPALARVITKATSFAPENRYASVRELEKAFASALVDMQEEVPQEQLKRSKGLLVVGAFAALAVIAAVAVVLVLIGNQGSGSGASSSAVIVVPPSGVSSASLSETSSAKTTAEAFDEPVLAETITFLNGYGKAAVVIGISNPNHDLCLQGVMVSITGKSSKGDVIISDRRRVANIYPGETGYIDIQTNCPELPDKLDIFIDDSSVKATELSEAEAPEFSFSGLNASSDGIGTHFYGEVQVIGDASALPANAQSKLLILLRDAGGNIIAGKSDYASISSQGEQSSFEVSWLNPPDYASWEAIVSYV